MRALRMLIDRLIDLWVIMFLPVWVCGFVLRTAQRSFNSGVDACDRVV